MIFSLPRNGLVAISLVLMAATSASAQDNNNDNTEPSMFPLLQVRGMAADDDVVAEPLMRMMGDDTIVYADGTGSMMPDLPNPRNISNCLAQHQQHPNQKKSRRRLSDMVWAWGQFIGAY